MEFTMKHLSFLFACLLLLSGCGVKGDLTRPGPVFSKKDQAQTPAPEKTDEEVEDDYDEPLDVDADDY